jgi:hypothetical protein
LKVVSSALLHIWKLAGNLKSESLFECCKMMDKNGNKIIVVKTWNSFYFLQMHT